MQKLVVLLLALTGFLAAAPATAQLYDVRASEVSYNKGPRPAVKVQVDGKASDVRDFLQSWMKSSYNIKFKGGGVLGLGKSDVLVARQTPASTVSGKLVDIYASVVAPADTITEVALFGGFDDNTFFDPDKTATEYNALRTIAQSFASAARLKAYRDQVTEAEKKLKTAEKEKDKLEKNRNYLRSNTASNLSRIEDLKKKNAENLIQSRSDSVSLISNGLLLEQSRVLLQRRRDQLSTLDRKN
ncbi:hypothetical protein BEN47_01785 [Hymenobacter lapidarius]|uniref:DUF4468 domain-containing protein n=1 Tax=Hymenobacter lapidarius TaxID=1908237 RepID=A0A1G1T600_9BACT|nr:hypothetical protein [Hymenobacter lapidarius]OGX86306.1 hypothetical protein BEN47_01785 [Hymenobacter lapidarius]